MDTPPGSESFEEMLLRLARIPVGPWKPCVLRFEHGTEVYWKQGHCLARWVTNEISVFENASGEIVGCRIENKASSRTSPGGGESGREAKAPTKSANLPPRGRPFEFTQEHLDALRELPQAPDED